MTTILESPEVVAAIEKEVQRGDSDIEQVKRKAFAQITEIASDQSYRVIRFFHCRFGSSCHSTEYEN